MDEREVERQLNQMRQFIIQEAQEKAAEILRKADEECALEKGRIIAAERQKIEQEYTRKRKQIEIQKKMFVSRSLCGTLHFLVHTSFSRAHMPHTR
jgi:V-type H+-transporting ATPase subunit E